MIIDAKDYRYGEDYFFDVFHTAEFIFVENGSNSQKSPAVLNSPKDSQHVDESASKHSQSKKRKANQMEKADMTTDIRYLSLVKKYPHLSERFKNLTAPDARIARLRECAEIYGSKAFDRLYYQEMLTSCGWEVFELVDMDNGKYNGKVYLPKESVEGKKICSSNYEEFVKGADYFVTKYEVLDYICKTYPLVFPVVVVSPAPTSSTVGSVGGIDSGKGVVVDNEDSQKSKKAKFNDEGIDSGLESSSFHIDAVVGKPTTESYQARLKTTAKDINVVEKSVLAIENLNSANSSISATIRTEVTASKNSSQLFNFLLKDEQSSIPPQLTTTTSTTSMTTTLSSGGNHVGSNRSIAMKKDDITR
jgi:hypothetical protein